jgi:pyridoxine 5-phosphate synthase
MTSLSVNLNRVALLRNSRPLAIPSVVHAATLVLEAGADGITLHPRPDERHVRPADVTDIAQLLTAWPAVEFNLEGNPFHQLMGHVVTVRPRQCTLVPDAMDAATSDHGWDLARDGARLRPLIDQARALGVRVSLFMDPDPESMAAARDLGAERVELYTEAYARAHGGPGQAASLERYRLAAEAALRVGLEVNAGHDLNLLNLGDFLRAVPGVAEVSIGHALIGDALEFGLAETVRRYQAVIRTANRPASGGGPGADGAGAAAGPGGAPHRAP